MSIKLLPASVNPLNPSQPPDVSTGLAPLTQRAIATRTGQISLVPSADAWSSSTRRSQPNVIHGTFLDDSPSDDTGRSLGEYVSGWSWTRSVESTAVAHYLSYAAGLAAWKGRLIDLYA
jgi:hypothetical protein